MACPCSARSRSSPIPPRAHPSFLVTDETDAGVDPQPAPAVSRDEAIAIAREATGASDLRGDVTAELGIEPGDDGGTSPGMS